ncbi:hypothetical protein EVA_17509, partial [gut metagenome]
VEVSFKQKSFARFDDVGNAVEVCIYGKSSPNSLLVFIGNPV